MMRTNSAESAPEREEKAAKTLSLIVVSFIVCWLPMTISFFVFGFKKDRGFTEEILDVCIILSHFNSAIDPLIYAYRIKDIRETVKSFLRCERLVENTIVRYNDGSNKNTFVQSTKSTKSLPS